MEHGAERAHGLGQGPAVRGQEVGEDLESLETVDWLFWVGCAGAFEDRAKKTTRAVAELLHMAGVSFAVLGNGETCTGDPARRAGNEFLFQELAQQNVETFKECKVKKVVATCAHCFNTLKNEYPQFGIDSRSSTTRSCSTGSSRGQADPGRARGRRRPTVDHLPRPVLPRPAQPGLRPPRELLQALPGASSSRWSATGAVLLLRRRWRPDVDGGEHRRAHQHRTAPRRPSTPAPTRSRSAARSAG